MSLLDRMAAKKAAGADEKDDGRQDNNGNDEPPREDDEHQQDDDNDQDDDDEDEGPGSRTVYFNLPLPPEMLDEDGAPKTTYARNKIRTAKYTPLSFVPKNLWFQFHNVANIFFLFLVILVVSTL